MESLIGEDGEVSLPDSEVRGYERANLILVLLVAQVVQVLVLALAVFAFFMVFGSIVMKHSVQEAWTGGTIHALPVADNLSVELVQVSVFLAAFSGLYFTVTVLTDETYRAQFFTGCDGRARPGRRRPGRLPRAARHVTGREDEVSPHSP